MAAAAAAWQWQSKYAENYASASDASEEQPPYADVQYLQKNSDDF